MPPDPPREVTWFGRLELGFGSFGFSETSSILSDLGYAGAKMWVTLDFAYMFHRHIGVGLWVGMNRRASHPEGVPALGATSYFLCAEVPILLGGNRSWAFHLTPRGGYAAADLRIGNGVSGSLEHTGTFGGAVSFQSFEYHLGGAWASCTRPPARWVSSDEAWTSAVSTSV